MAGVVDGGAIDARPGAPLPQRRRRARRPPPLGHHRAVRRGPRRARACSLATYPTVESIGIDTWAVDYGLLDATASLLADPIAYRDDRDRPRSSTTCTSASSPGGAVRDQRAAVPAVQHHLPARGRAASGPSWDAAAHVVLLPDLLAYWLTGELRTEATNASTTGLVDVAHRTVVDRAPRPARHPGRPAAADRAPGRRSGARSTPSFASDSGCRPDGGHHGRLARHRLRGRRRARDRPSRSPTSPAAPGRSSASSSTRPVVTPDEPGRELHQRGRRRRTHPLPAQRRRPVAPPGVAAHVDRSRATRRPRPRCWPRRPRCPPAARRSTSTTPASSPPGDMPARITAAVAAQRRPRRRRPAATVRCILDSLAAAYARTVGQAGALTGRPVDVDPRRRRRLAERAALPAHRRRRRLPVDRRTGRGDRPRQRARPGAGARRRARSLEDLRAAHRGARDLRAPAASVTETREPSDRSADRRHAPLGRALRPHRDRPGRASAGPGRVGRRPAPHRQAPAARRRVRLHRRRRRGRAHPGRQRGRVRRGRRSGPACCAASTTVDIGSTILGRPVAYPLVLAPTGFTRIADPEGELAVARAAARAGLPYTLSTLSTRSIEEVRAVSDGRLWFQVYAWRDRGLVKEMIDRAAAADYEALVLTVDTAVFGRRERDVRRGLLAAADDRARHDPRRRAAPGLDLGVRPRRADPLRQRRRPGRRRRRLAGHAVGLHQHPVRSGAVLGRRRVAALGVGRPDRRQGHPDGRGRRDRRRRRRRRHRPVEPRRPPARRRPGRVRPRRARSPTPSAGAPRSSATAASGAGSDIVKAVAAGATACMAGRAYLYGLGAAGERGVDRVLDWFRADLMPHDEPHRRRAAIADLDRSLLDLPRIRSRP